MAHGDITHIDIPVTDLAKASTFYSTLFGWQIAEVPGFEGYPMWQAPNKISGGGLAPRDDSFTQPRSYVEVDSIVGYGCDDEFEFAFTLDLMLDGFERLHVRGWNSAAVAGVRNASR